MTAYDNIIKAADTVKALDIEFVKTFQQEYDRLVEIVGLFPADTMAAGTALYQYKITGSLLDGSTSDGTSGTAYTEGDFIARSNYKVTKEQIGEVEFYPYAKQTTAQAILKGGFENAVMRTDRKAQQQMRAAILNDFFTFLANGTSAASPESSSETWDLQALLAYTGAVLGDKLETNGDEGGDVVYFINRQDAAKYLANATISTQETFGMTYLENFLGVENVLLTNKVATGTLYATPVENIHVYGLDFSALGSAGLSYETNSLGLVGVHHEPDYNYGSAETYLVRGCKFIPEITDYIVKGSMTYIEPSGDTGETGETGETA